MEHFAQLGHRVGWTWRKPRFWEHPHIWGQRRRFNQQDVQAALFTDCHRTPIASYSVAGHCLLSRNYVNLVFAANSRSGSARTWVQPLTTVSSALVAPSPTLPIRAVEWNR
jgi:hypothetical protein